jgi:hypothetical protein
LKKFQKFPFPPLTIGCGYGIISFASGERAGEVNENAAISSRGGRARAGSRESYYSVEEYQLIDSGFWRLIID